MENCTLKFRDGILIATYKKNLAVDLELAKELVQARLDFTKGVEYPVVIYLNSLKTTSKEARDYMAKEGIVGITIGTFIVENFIEKAVLNFFLPKQTIPVKSFTNEEDAIKWIKSKI